MDKLDLMSKIWVTVLSNADSDLDLQHTWTPLIYFSGFSLLDRQLLIDSHYSKASINWEQIFVLQFKFIPTVSPVPSSETAQDAKMKKSPSLALSASAKRCHLVHTALLVLRSACPCRRYFLILGIHKNVSGGASLVAPGDLRPILSMQRKILFVLLSMSPCRGQWLNKIPLRLSPMSLTNGRKRLPVLLPDLDGYNL